MLPIITVGLSPAALAVVERISGDRATAHYATAEEALWQLGTDANPTVSGIRLDSRGRKWACHVLYGDNALGALLTHTEFGNTTPTRVPAVGLIGVITDTVGADPTEPHRVVDGQAENKATPKIAAVEAVKLLRAGLLLVVDKLSETPDWQSAVERSLANADGVPDGVPDATLGFVPGAEAKAELARAEELRSRGMARPAHFESKGPTLR